MKAGQNVAFVSQTSLQSFNFAIILIFGTMNNVFNIVQETGKVVGAVSRLDTVIHIHIRYMQQFFHSHIITGICENVRRCKKVHYGQCSLKLLSLNSSL